MQQILAVDGMFCGGCSATIERVLANTEGVKSASVSFVCDAAVVELDIARTNVSVIANVVRRLGYGVRPLGDGSASADRSASTQRGDLLRRHQYRLVVAIALGMWVMFASLAGYLNEVPSQAGRWWLALAAGVLALPVLTYSASTFYRLAWRSLRARAPGMELLISTAVVAAVLVSVVNLCLGSSIVYFDAAVMLITFQLIARLTDFKIRRDAGDTIRSMMALAPEQARFVPSTVAASDTSPRMVAVRDLAVGDVVECRAGERVPVDGTIMSGHGSADCSLLTGESTPREVAPEQAIEAGVVVLDTVLRIRVDAGRGKRQIDALSVEVRRLITGKSALARLTDRIAGWLLPVILISAVAALLFALATGAGLQVAIARALAVMVVTCPCALSLAVPLVVARAAAAANRQQAVLRDPGALESADRIDTVLLDKTGTLTTGSPQVVAMHPCSGQSMAALLATASLPACRSNHPVSKAICAVAQNQQPIVSTDGLSQEVAGRGISFYLAGGAVLRIGSAAWFDELQLSRPALAASANTRTWVARDESVLGAIDLADTLRPQAPAVVAHLQRRGYRLMIASGDRQSSVDAIATTLGIAGRGQMRPQDKLELIRELQAQGKHVAFVGDGLNDGPALAAADLGIAVASATDLARAASAVGIIRGGDIAQVQSVLTLSRRAARLIKQNLVFALAYNGLLLPAAVLGYIHPVGAAIAMGLSSISVSLNVLRLPLASRSNIENSNHTIGAPAVIP